MTRKIVETSKSRRVPRLTLARGSLALKDAPQIESSNDASANEWMFGPFFEQAPIALAVWNLEGSLSHSNAALKAVFHDSHPLAPSLKNSGVVRRLSIRHYISRIRKGDVVRLPTFWHTTQSKHPDATASTRLAVAITLFPLRNEAKQITAIGGMFRDETDLMEAQEQLQLDTIRLEHSMEERTAELAAANVELEAFSYSVSHDLRSPLRAIDGYAARLIDAEATKLSETGNAYLQRIRASAQRLSELINDLLTFARMGKQPLNKRPVDSEQLISAVLEDLEPHWLGRDIEIVRDHLPIVQADPSLLREVFFNLLDNALKFSDQRPHTRIEISCDTHQSPWIWSVRDNGVGFNMDYSAQLFRVFSRLHSVQEFEGTGVGLALVQRVVQRHGGKIWAHAEKDVGAAFYFTLEASPPAAS